MVIAGVKKIGGDFSEAPDCVRDVANGLFYYANIVTDSDLGGPRSSLDGCREEARKLFGFLERDQLNVPLYLEASKFLSDLKKGGLPSLALGE